MSQPLGLPLKFLNPKTTVKELVSKISTWFDLKSNSRAIHGDVRKLRIASTGDWFIDSKEYKEWKATKGGVLCGIGIPAAGKTVLMTRVIDDLLPLENDKTCVLFVYNRYTEPLSLCDILKGFILQVLERHPALAKHVEPLYKRHKQEKTQPSPEELTQLLVQFGRFFERMFYAVDGVDEVDKETRYDLIQVLNELQGNIVLASRQLEELNYDLKGAVYLRLVAQEKDIRLLIEERLKRYKGLARLLYRHSYYEIALNEIISKAEGMFLHAALQVDALQSCLTIPSVKQTLEQLPRGMERIYRTTLVRIEHQAPELVKAAKHILVWLICAQGPLRIKDLQAALAVNPKTFSVERDSYPDTESIVSICCGLVEHHAQTGVVRLVHFTAKEALTPILLHDCPQPHEYISKVLMRRLLDEGLPNSWTITCEDEFSYALTRRPLLEYAYNYWVDHIKACEYRSDISRYTLDFLLQCTSFPVVDVVVIGSDIQPLDPLQVAARYNFSDELSVLITDKRVVGHYYGAQLRSGYTALMIAARYGYLTCVDHLLKVKVELTRPIPASIQSNPDELNNFNQWIQAMPANVPDPLGRTALIWASRNHHGRIVERLLQLPGIEVDASDYGGRTALTWAVEGGQGAIAWRLLEAGANFNAVGKDGRAPLVCASENGREDIVVLLLGISDLDVNATDGGRTALIWALRRGHREIARCLVRHPGVDLKVRDVDGSTALGIAVHMGFEDVVREMVERGVDNDATYVGEEPRIRIYR
ncbi:hypothetical protein CC1G_08519 [Coprinopsis cinerea okayama7|uniref:Uncharacterized protein n=1 Tax=Coprinopsis cinerea (strain Okayama-7 / 130 / ATCC MYA-4618 / FGSC 9003) TaxID=240176 RepID=A8ND39_COPC7|nr:hypothetical protein CC1G_08519 [Coprinopsis cinerea okayama7\|eukprot:XP_001832691.2 hypothetical protein CC1G_08519 [Coprinopsis cinerea okayama7\